MAYFVAMKLRDKKPHLKSILLGALSLSGLHFFTPVANAQETEQLSLEAQSALPQSDYSKALQIKGQLKSEATKYQSAVKDSKLNQSILVGAQLKLDYKTELTSSTFDFSAERFVDWQHSQFSVKELFWSKSRPDGKTLNSIGRKVEYWSVADSEWHLGLWQPKQAFDGLRPEVQGLTGAFVKHQSGDFEWLGLVSPIFIPTMEPEIKNDNGNLSAESRWFKSPSSTFSIFDKERRVVYSVKTPNLAELVTKPGASFRLKYDRQQGLWSSVAMAYKPLNKLLLKYEKKLVTDGQNEDTGSAPLYPVVGYHSLVSADLGYRFSNYELSMSYLEDRPLDVKQASDDPYIIQHAKPSKVYSWLASTKMDQLWPTKLSVGYLRVDGGDIVDLDAQGKYQGAVFASRYQYTHAVQLMGEFKTDLRDRQLVTKVKYLRDFDQRAALWSGEFNYFPKKEIMLTLGADILGGDRRESEADATGFLNEFRANDRAYTGVSYVF